MRNVLKLKNIKPDIIEASVSSHAGDNFLTLYAKFTFFLTYTLILAILVRNVIACKYT